MRSPAQELLIPMVSLPPPAGFLPSLASHGALSPVGPWVESPALVSRSNSQPSGSSRSLSQEVGGMNRFTLRCVFVFVVHSGQSESRAREPAPHVLLQLMLALVCVCGTDLCQV